MGLVQGAKGAVRLEILARLVAIAERPAVLPFGHDGTPALSFHMHINPVTRELLGFVVLRACLQPRSSRVGALLAWRELWAGDLRCFRRHAWNVSTTGSDHVASERER